MSPPEFALMVIAVMAITALPAWAWWAAADDDGPEVLPDHRLRAVIAASACLPRTRHPLLPFPTLLKELA